MSNHFSMGAINKITNKYEYPKIANKINKYKCPCCEKDVSLKKGPIKRPHFAHYKSDNPCCYYDKPSETQVHKDAKLLMKSLLDHKNNIFIRRSCNYCEQRNCGYTEGLHYDIFYDDYNENTKVVLEHKFYYNNSNRSADIALIEGDKIKYIFEICYKNKTKEENRPEPWIEIDAENLINQINFCKIIDEEGNINIKCIRNYKCDECIDYEKKENMKKKLYYEKLKQENEIQEKERNEYFIKEQERKMREKLKQKEEEKMKYPCKCGINIINICVCETPKYELIKLSNNLFCINCNKWKCRCKN